MNCKDLVHWRYPSIWLEHLAKPMKCRQGGRRPAEFQPSASRIDAYTITTLLMYTVTPCSLGNEYCNSPSFLPVVSLRSSPYFPSLGPWETDLTSASFQRDLGRSMEGLSPQAFRQPLSSNHDHEEGRAFQCSKFVRNTRDCVLEQTR